MLVSMNTHPNHRHYDVVIVGARAAGASTAMLLADAGLRVLAVDRQAYGSDTLSSHALMRGAVSRLARWGLLEEIFVSTPTITRTTFAYGPESIELEVKPEPGIAGLAAPRRTILDPILVDGARNAGAEVLHDTRLGGLVTGPSGRVSGVDLILATGEEIVLQADLVIGADGLGSSVARAVGAPVTRQGRHASAYTMRYYDDLGCDQHEFMWLYDQGIGGGVIPTSDGATCVFTAVPPHRFRSEARGDVAGAHRRVIKELGADLAWTVGTASPMGSVRSFPGVRGQFRQAVGEGWALVGDAGYFKDPFAAHGITDAFRDAELLTKAVLDDDLPWFEATRNELSMSLFETLDEIASYRWNLDELKHLHHRLSRAMKAEEDASEVRWSARTLRRPSPVMASADAGLS